MSKQTSIIILIIALIIVGVGVYYFSKNDNTNNNTQNDSITQNNEENKQNEQTPSGTEEEENISNNNENASAETKEITVDGYEFKFEPKDITVKAGEKVKLTFKNEGNAPHNLSISELGVKTKTINGEGTDVIEFTASKTGTYEFICAVPGHKERGMVGHMMVE